MSKKIYADLSAKLGAPNSERFVRVLEAMYTPDEAVVCHELVTGPATLKELTAKLKIAEKELAGMLDALVDKGSVTRGKTQYGYHPNVLGLHHDVVADPAPHTGPHAVPKKVLEAWADFFRNEWSYTFLEHTEKMIQATGRSLPIWPAIGALERSPNLSPDQVLPQENWKLSIEKARRRIIAPCGCRITWGVCDHPVMTCFACFDRPRGAYYLNQPGRILKEVTLAETIDIVRESEESGLVHWGDCYCCDCCCENLFPITRSKRYELMTPNRYLAVVDTDKCKGCQECMDRCYFEAIEMKPVTGSKKLKASISPEKCKGCGLCIITCPQNAIRYEIVRPPEYLLGPRSVTGVAQGPGGPSHRVPVFGFYELK